MKVKCKLGSAVIRTNICDLGLVVFQQPLVNYVCFQQRSISFPKFLLLYSKLQIFCYDNSLASKPHYTAE